MKRLNPKHFGKRLKKARETHLNVITQEELGRAIGLSAAHISHFECGRRLPSLNNFAGLVRALSVSADSLLGK